MTNSHHNARQIGDYAILLLGMVVVVIVALNVADVLTTGITLVTGVFDSLTLPDPTAQNGTIR